MNVRLTSNCYSINRCYVVMTTTKTPQLPYADAFVPYLKYCITWVSPDRCKLACHTGVKFIKNILVKGIVSKAAMSGMSENLKVFVPIIQNEVNKQSGSKVKGKAAQEEAPLNVDSVKEPVSAAVEKEADWYSQYVDPVIQTVRDLVEGLPLSLKASFGVLVILWFLYSWLFRAGSRTVTVDQAKPSQVVFRAVYLKDIDEGLLNRDIKSAYQYSDRYFQTYRKGNKGILTTFVCIASACSWSQIHATNQAIDIVGTALVIINSLLISCSVENALLCSDMMP